MACSAKSEEGKKNRLDFWWGVSVEGDRWPQHWCREALFQPGAPCQATPSLFGGTSATWRLGGVVSQEFTNERHNQGQGFRCFAELEQNCEGARQARADQILALDPRSVTALPAQWIPGKCISLMSFLTWDLPHVAFQANKCRDNQHWENPLLYRHPRFVFPRLYRLPSANSGSEVGRKPRVTGPSV